MAAETKSFVVAWFTDASYFGGDEDCPDGLNPSSIDFYRRDLTREGLPKDQIEAALKEFPGEGSTQPWVPLVTVRGNGKDNVYLHPETAPDPGLKTVKGRFANGFNLDGNEATGGFINPETKERGVDNQYYRALGCIRSYRGAPPPAHPGQAENNWDTVRHQMTAWLITLSSPTSLSSDGDVTVTLDRALEPAAKGGNGNIQADMTYHVDPDPRSHNVLHGTIKGGVVTTAPADVAMLADPFIMAVFKFSKARLRLQVAADGALNGIIGGYMPRDDVWYSFANQGHIKEYAASIDLPGVYYALKRFSDADPDPKTGENKSISSAYRIEAVPAFVLKADAKTAQR
jgi:hypothetical protein